MSSILEGLKVLVLEDEFLIAMDVEQLCLDNGAQSVVVARRIEDVDPSFDFDAAIVDVMLSGVSTFEFADRLLDAGKPFVFASGYVDNAEVAERFPGVAMVGKPYAGRDLIDAVAAACGRVALSGGT